MSRKIGYTKDDYPCLSEFEAESERYKKEDYEPTEGYFANCFSCMKEYADNFFKSESHRTNIIHI